MTGDLPRQASAYEVLAGYYDQLMDEIDYDYWCDYVLSLVEPAVACQDPVTVVAGRIRQQSAAVDQVKPLRVLDLACGTGQFAYRLRQRGLDVTAVDVSSEMLAVAEAKTRSMDLDVRFVQQDMRSLELPASYDLVLCLCDSLNYLLEPDDLAAAFHNVVRVLEPGGQFVFDINTEHKLAAVYGDNTYAADLGEYAYIWQNEYQPDTKLCYMDLTFFIPVAEIGDEGEPRQTGLFERIMESHVQRAFSPELVGSLLTTVGLEVLGQYDDLTLVSPKPTTERITFHCRKP
ncbi:MAG: methyltransferase domain-containing protein [Firmicutes bacterium]|nr:methyltransferase domain-containing protein [Bacillota bacterium]